MMKRIIFISLLFVVNAFSVFAQRFDVTYKNVTFKCKLNKGLVTITSFSVDAPNVVIPSTVQYKGIAYPVNKVSTFFNGNNYLAENLVVEEGIQRIDRFAFAEFRKLKTVRLPASIKYIGNNAFRKIKGIEYLCAEKFDTNLIADRNAKISVWDTATDNFLKAAPVKMQSIGNNTREDQATIKKNPVEEVHEKPTPTITTAVSLVDSNIPQSKVVNKHTYCVIIANEHYEEAPNVDYALNDGQIFKEYCIKALGVPEKQVRTYTDASYTDVLKALRFIENIPQFDTQAKIILYYSGHGMPDEKDFSAYLLPTDGSPKEMQTCISMKDIYNRLGKVRAQQITVLMDACFSGMRRSNDGGAILAARAVAVETKKEVLTGNVVVLTAASGDETAFAFHSQRHGLFTYYLLEELQKNHSRLTLGSLFESLKANVAKSSVLENDKLQTPSVMTSAEMRMKWKSLLF
ncbi:MAG: caspase family protein [Prevotella sp.]|nr:caspase family protein [Prevotella sp.]